MSQLHTLPSEVVSAVDPSPRDTCEPSTLEADELGFDPGTEAKGPPATWPNRPGRPKEERSARTGPPASLGSRNPSSPPLGGAAVDRAERLTSKGTDIAPMRISRGGGG
jgi:hypothetical protein